MMQAAGAGTSGTLKITVVEANLTRNTETFGKMDPYVKLETRMQKFKTTTINSGGKTPKWTGQTFQIDVKYIGDDLNLSVWDEDVGSDDIVGSAVIKLSSFCAGNGVDEWFEIQHKGKKSGVVHITSQWTPAGGAKAAKAAPAGVAAMGAAGYPQMQQPMMQQPMQQPMMQ